MALGFIGAEVIKLKQAWFSPSFMELMSNRGHEYEVNSYKHFFHYIHKRNNVAKIQRTLKLYSKEPNLVSSGNSRFKPLETYFPYDLECLCIRECEQEDREGGSSSLVAQSQERKALCSQQASLAKPKYSDISVYTFSMLSKNIINSLIEKLQYTLFFSIKG